MRVKLEAVFRARSGVVGRKVRAPLAQTNTVAQPDAIVDELQALIDAEVIHYMSFFVIDPATIDGKRCPALVALEISCDGSASAMRRRLSKAKTFLNELFKDCEGFDPDSGERGLARFLKKIDAGGDLVFIAFPGHTVKQIRKEQELRAKACRQFEKLASSEARAAGGCPMHASTAKSPRLSPTTASATWRELQHTLGSDEDVQNRPPRPFWVRWSLKGNLRARLNLWGKPLGTALFALITLLGVCRIVQAGSWAVAAAGSAQFLYLTALTVLWWRESPRSLSWRGGFLIFWNAIGSLLWRSVVAAAVLGTIAVLISAALRLPPGVALLSILAFLGFYVAARRTGVSDAALAFGQALLLLTALLPQSMLPLVPCFVLAIPGLALVLLAAVFCHVMYGRIAAWFGGALVLVLTSGLIDFVHRLLDPTRSAPLIGIGWLVALLLVAYAGVFHLVVWMMAIRRLEASDVPGPIAWDHDRLEFVQEREDHWLQNHLATVSPIKPDKLRLCTLRRVLRAVHLLAKVYANRGDLGGIRTIHFGRFLVLPDDKRLLFLGNYDGGFGSYLQEFNRVLGVTAIWSNCVEFPRSFYLVGAGAYDEQRFKALARRNQVRTLGWYSAYPELAIRDIEVAASTRESLGNEIADPFTVWGRVRTHFGRPLTEADCDAALRRL